MSCQVFHSLGITVATTAYTLPRVSERSRSHRQKVQSEGGSTDEHPWDDQNGARKSVWRQHWSRQPGIIPIIDHMAFIKLLNFSVFSFPHWKRKRVNTNQRTFCSKDWLQWGYSMKTPAASSTQQPPQMVLIITHYGGMVHPYGSEDVGTLQAAHTTETKHCLPRIATPCQASQAENFRANKPNALSWASHSLHCMLGPQLTQAGELSGKCKNAGKINGYWWLHSVWSRWSSAEWLPLGWEV